MGFVVALVIMCTIINLIWIFNPAGAHSEGAQGLVWYRTEIGEKQTYPKNSFCANNSDLCDTYVQSTVGFCSGLRPVCQGYNSYDNDTSVVFISSYIVLQMILLLYSIYIGYKTRNIDTDFAEGKFIMMSIINQFQLGLVGIASFGFLRNSINDPNAVTMVIICVLGFGNFATLGLIFIPKVLAYLIPSVARKLSSTPEYTNSSNNQSSSSNSQYTKEKASPPFV